MGSAYGPLIKERVMRQAMMGVCVMGVCVMGVMGMAGGVARGQCATAYTFSGFGTHAGLTAVGNASFTDGVARLTPSTDGQSGAVWYTASKTHVRDGFSTTFTFTTNGNTADGLAFVIQNQSATARGGGGSAMGYSASNFPGIRSSVAVEIDTFNFPDEFPADHVSVQTRGQEENSSDDSASLGHAVLGFDVNDGELHTVRIDYAPGAMTVWVDDLDVPVLTVALNLDDINEGSILDGGGCAWIGFTAATGAAVAAQDIVSWTVAPVGACVPLSLDLDHSALDFSGVIGEPFEQTAAFTGSFPRTYVWRVNDIPLVESARIHGVHTPHLVIDRLTPAEVGDYGVIVENECSGVGIGYRPSFCGSADFNGDGDVGTDQDIESFFRCLAGNCCTLCVGADFNFDGDIGTDQDIEAFFRVLAGGGC